MKETKYCWIAASNDRSLFDKGCHTHTTREECYNDMRDAVLSKMTWNTIFNEDFERDCDVIPYKVWFRKDMIVHSSFSGDYIYLIVDADNLPSMDYLLGRLDEFLGHKPSTWFPTMKDYRF